MALGLRGEVQVLGYRGLGVRPESVLALLCSRGCVLTDLAVLGEGRDLTLGLQFAEHQVVASGVMVMLVGVEAANSVLPVERWDRWCFGGGSATCSTLSARVELGSSIHVALQEAEFLEL